MEGLLVLAALVVVVPLVGGALYWQRQITERRLAVWRAFAERRGGRFVPGEPGLFRQRAAGVEVPSGVALVYLDTFVVSHGKTSTTYTRARAAFSVGGGPSFRVSEEGALASLGKMFGAQDIELGGGRPRDHAFDGRFVVKGDDPRGIRDAWTAGARDGMGALADLCQGALADSDGEVVTVRVIGAHEDLARVEAIVDLAGELASFGARELEGLADLPDARFVGGGGTWSDPVPPQLRVALASGEVEIRPLTRRGPLRAQLRLEHERDLPAFSADLGDDEVSGLPGGLVPDHARARLSRVGRATLVGDARSVKLTWPRWPERGALEAGVGLLEAIGGRAPSEGAFR